jgi:hypothetical protein
VRGQTRCIEVGIVSQLADIGLQMGVVGKQCSNAVLYGRRHNQPKASENGSAKFS